MTLYGLCREMGECLPSCGLCEFMHIDPKQWPKVQRQLKPKPPRKKTIMVTSKAVLDFADQIKRKRTYGLDMVEELLPCGCIMLSGKKVKYCPTHPPLVKR